VWLSRKGAIDASTGVAGVIPGSTGTRSYVVTGKGSPLSLDSSARRESPSTAARPHARGSRPQTCVRRWGTSSTDTDAFLDEIPAAYKDIDVVMEDAEDLVKVRHVLRQIVNVRGD
jgi:tRNA-splicing ligase RtcB